MQIRLYDDPQKLPGASVHALSLKLLSKEEIEGESAVELKAFLRALFSINLPLAAHVHIERDMSFGGGEAIRMAITSEVSEDSELLLIWQKGYENKQGEKVEHNWIHLDMNPNLVAKEFHKKYVSKMKNEGEWVIYFLTLFEKIRTQKQIEIVAAEQFLSHLTLSRRLVRDKPAGVYTEYSNHKL